MAKLYNLARVRTATIGAGTLALGAAVSGFLTFAASGVQNGDVIAYSIRDGTNSEIGYGTYTSSGATLTRTVRKSTNSDAAISLSGNAIVLITPSAEDLQSDIALGDGTAALPALAFQSDDDTGLYRIGANEIGFSVGGAGTGIGLSATALYPIADEVMFLGKTTNNYGGLYLASTGFIDFESGDIVISRSSPNTLQFAGAASGYLFTHVIAPATSDGAALGSASLMWSDAFFASGAVLNFNSSDVLITHAANQLTFSGGTNGYFFDTAIAPASDDGAPLGTTSFKWADLFLASGGVINFNAGNATITHGTDQLTFGVGGSSEVILTTTALSPAGDSGSQLGTTTLRWAHLFLATTSTINWGNGDILITGSANALAFSGASSGYTFDAVVAPASSDGAALGSTSLMFSDLFLASGAVVNFNAGDVTITHSANQLNFGGASVGYLFDGPTMPSANDAAALGASGQGWSDLFLASGAVINFNAGDATLTHAANVLAFAGAASGYTFDNLLITGHTASLSVNSLAANMQLYGTTNATSAFTIGLFDATAGDYPRIQFYRSKNAAIGSATVVASGDVLGAIGWFGAQQSGTFATQTRAAQIRAEVDGTVTSGASGDMPARLIFSTTADGGSDVTDRLILDSAGVLKPAANDGLALGTTALSFSDLFLATGGVINWAAGGVTITESSDVLLFAGAASGYRFDSTVVPTSNDGSALGNTSNQWSDLFLAEGGVINWDNGDAALTQTGNDVILTGAQFVVNANSLATINSIGGTSIPKIVAVGADSTQPTMQIQSYAGASPVNVPVIHLLKARGTAATPTAVQSGDLLGASFAYGYQSTTGAFVTSAGSGFIMTATEAYTSTAAGARLDVYTTPTGSVTLAQAASFGQDKSLTIAGVFMRVSPATKTADFTLAATESYIINNRAATNTATLPAASAWPGREVFMKTIQAQTVVSASSDVVPSTSATAGTAILPATDGAWALLVSDGTNWVIMAANPLV